MRKINVIGLGYIGLPTALALAANGYSVVGTDYNKNVVDTLNAGKVTFKEKGLYELFESALTKDIEFTTEYLSTDIYIISVPTPYIKESKKTDTSYIESALKSILDVCLKNSIIVIESTVSPGTIDRYLKPIIEEKGFVVGKDINVVHAPERILPGNMIYELENDSRIIGADDKEIGEKVKKIYSCFCKAEIVVTDIKTAEMTKVVENTFRDINIAFANELAKICRAGNMDVYEIVRLANLHPRVNVLQPGPGVGGHCIPVDPWFLVGDYSELSNVILAARNVNDSMPEFVLERISSIMEENKINDISRVGLYGLTYKENVDDVRESPTLQMLEKIDKYFPNGIKVFDPYIEKDIVDNQYHDFDKFLNDIDMVVILVSHRELLDNIDMIKNKIIFDTRNVCKFNGVYHI